MGKAPLSEGNPYNPKSPGKQSITQTVLSGTVVRSQRWCGGHGTASPLGLGAAEGAYRLSHTWPVTASFRL